MLIGISGRQALLPQRTGVENYAHQVIKNMLSLGSNHRFRLYYQNANFDPKKEGFDAENIEFVRIGWNRFWTQGGLAMETFIRPPDVLFIPEHTMPILRRPGMKVVTTIHDLGAQFLPEYHKFPHKLYLNFATEYAANHAVHLIAVSQATKKDLIDLLKVPSSRISVVYEGYDKSVYRPPSTADRKKTANVLKKYKIKGDYVLFVGTIQPRKNLVNLIEAFGKLKFANLSLVLGGGEGWLSGDIYESPKRFGVADKVAFTGFIDPEDLPFLYWGARVFALPSLFEGFGLPALEAMACGTPVVASETSSLPEVVGGAGLLCDPSDPDDIAEKITRVLKESKLSDQMVSKGIIQAQKFSWEKAAAETLRVLESLNSKS